MHRTFDEVWLCCCFRDMWAYRQTDRQTRSSQYCASLPGSEQLMLYARYNVLMLVKLECCNSSNIWWNIDNQICHWWQMLVPLGTWKVRCGRPTRSSWRGRSHWVIWGVTASSATSCCTTTRTFVRTFVSLSPLSTPTICSQVAYSPSSHNRYILTFYFISECFTCKISM